jgi:heat shock protein HslJ
MRRRRLLSLPTGVVLALATATLPACATPALLGTTWVLAGDGPRQPSLTLDPAAARVNGQAGCNRISGSFELDGERLRFGRMLSTRRACFPDDGSEERFLASLAQVRRWQLQGNRLLLLPDEGRQPLLTLQPAPPAR